MFLAIEGVDGVGKTTVSKIMAERLGCDFAEKPFRMLLGEGSGNDIYKGVADRVNRQPAALRAWFYGTGMVCLTERYREQPVVADRYLLSNFAYNGAVENAEIFDLLVRRVRIPELTVLLTADDDTVIRRLSERGENEPDIGRAHMNRERTELMRLCLSRYSLPHMIIPTDLLTAEQVCDKICEKINCSKN